MRFAILYLLLVGGPLVGLLPVLSAGRRLEAPPALSGRWFVESGGAVEGGALNVPSLMLLLLQVAVILVVARVVGLLFRHLRQPQVVGEMAAGIVLGPSLFGWLAPGLFAALFPAGSLPHLNTLSQIGLLLFMFLVGLEFDPRLLRGRGQTAVVTSHVSIVIPFFLGAAFALFLYPRLSDDSVSFTGFALFLGAAMSVTAFPVLARILTERNLLQTRVGAVAIACAAVDDVTAWSILAFVVAMIRAGDVHTPLWLTLAGTVVFIAVMAGPVRRLVARIETVFHNHGARLTQNLLALVVVLLLASAWTTEWLGVHALFGAFACGAVMPKGQEFVHELSVRLEDITVVFLLPIFFAFTGLRTNIGLIHGAEMWGYAAAALLIAVSGKFGGSSVAARLTGMSWREAGAVGILMNTRGLMELVILTIGLELGVISPALFTIMVFMALLTTAMTTPVLELLYPTRLIREAVLPAEEPSPQYTVLIPLSLPRSGPGLLDAALALAPPDRARRVYALHLTRVEGGALAGTPGLTPAEVFGPLLEHARHHGVEVRALSLYSRDFGEDIMDVARVKRADLIVTGWHKPVLGENVLSGTVGHVLQHAPMHVAVLVDRDTTPWRRVCVITAAADATSPLAQLAVNFATAGADVTSLNAPLQHPQSSRSLFASEPLDAHTFDLIATTLPPDGTSLRRADLERIVGTAVERRCSLLLVRPMGLRRTTRAGRKGFSR